MRIIQAVGWYFPERVGGTEVYVAALSKRLRAKGHEVEIVVPEPGGREPRSYVHDEIRVHRYPIPVALTRDQAQGRAAIDPRAWFAQWIQAVKPDVVHFHTLVPGLELPEVLAARATTRARLVATTHASSLGHICARGTLMQWGERPCDGLAGVSKCAACELQKRGLSKAAARAIALVPPIVGRIAGAIPGKPGTALGMTAAIAFNQTRQANLIDAVDRFVVLTRAAADIVNRNGAPTAKVALNRLGIDRSGPVRRRVDRTTRPVRVGYVGRFDPIKGIYDLARAVQALPLDTTIRVDFCGPAETDEARRVRDEIQQQLHGHPLTTFGPALPPSQVAAHLAGLDVLCCPSTCHEGGPTVAIEAHAEATPVIGTRIGGLAELVTDGVNGRLVAPGDWRALASLLAEIAADPASSVDRWRYALPLPRTMDDVTADYLELYAA